MLPRWHVLWGAIFTLIIWFFSPSINPLYLILLFLATIFIDFDHYAISCKKHKTLSIPHALKYYEKYMQEEEERKKKGIRKRGDFHLFHTVEFHLLVALLGILWTGFFYIFIGMVFHSLLDLVYLMHKDIFHIREFFLFNWLRNKDFS